MWVTTRVVEYRASARRTVRRRRRRQRSPTGATRSWTRGVAGSGSGERGQRRPRLWRETDGAVGLSVASRASRGAQTSRAPRESGVHAAGRVAPISSPLRVVEHVAHAVGIVPGRRPGPPSAEHEHRDGFDARGGGGEAGAATGRPTRGSNRRGAASESHHAWRGSDGASRRTARLGRRSAIAASRSGWKTKSSRGRARSLHALIGGAATSRAPLLHARRPFGTRRARLTAYVAPAGAASPASRVTCHLQQSVAVRLTQPDVGAAATRRSATADSRLRAPSGTRAERRPPDERAPVRRVARIGGTGQGESARDRRCDPQAAWSALPRRPQDALGSTPMSRSGRRGERLVKTGAGGVVSWVSDGRSDGCTAVAPARSARRRRWRSEQCAAARPRGRRYTPRFSVFTRRRAANGEAASSSSC